MTTTDDTVRKALGDLDARLDQWKQTVVELYRIPGVSAAGFPPEEVRRSAEAMAQTLRDAGVEHVEAWRSPACARTSTAIGSGGPARLPCCSTGTTT